MTLNAPHRRPPNRQENSVVNPSGILAIPSWALLILAVGVAMFAGQAAMAVPVFGEVRTLPQPDGSPVELRIWGDEYYGVTETLDGYTVVRDPETFFFCYADLTPDQNDLVSTGKHVGSVHPQNLGLKAHLRIRPESSTEKALQARALWEEEDMARGGGSSPRGPTTGSVQGICLIIDFADAVGTISPATVVNYCNQVGYTGFGNNGSVRDYYYDVSEGRLTYTNYVPGAYYRAAHNKSYYTNPAIPYGTRARELILEALNYLENNGFDFSLYDADGNGQVDALNCFYAGTCPNNWAEGLWPHASSISFCADGVCTYRYQITDMGASLYLATFCHENGHMLMGWPDLYDYDYDSNGVGRFCLMCYGTSSTNPCEPCAYMKYIAGWSVTTSLVAPQAYVQVPSTSNTFYKYHHPTLSNEYYLFENRQQSGRDSQIPDAGLAIWHIDTTGSNNNQQMTPTLHYLVTLVQADGRWDMEHASNYGDDTDLWSSPTYVQCTPTTTPNTNWWSGAASDLSITRISASGTNMTFWFNAEDCNNNGIADNEDIAGGTSQDCNFNDIPDECETGDICPPTPNPPSWVQEPTPTGTTSITMQAYASDPSGVEYTFDAAGNNSHDRGWAAAGAYTDSGLDINRNYTYRVKARDLSATLNEGFYTDVVAVATNIQTPAALSVGTVTETSITVTAPGTFTRLASAQSGLYFEVLDPGDNPVGGSNANAWVKTQTITATGLTSGVTYRFRVKARNYYGENETAWYPASGYTSQATQGASCTLLGDMNGDGLVNGSDVGGFVRTKLGGTLLPGENAACANYGGTLEQDIADFVNDLLGAA
jgi:M6 family metalloprotease-like protein